MMNKNERIAKIERTLLMMEYKEHWTPADWAERAELNAKLKQLKGEA